jgi:hypothetical protein
MNTPKTMTVAARRRMWDAVNWSLNNLQIARLTGMHHDAVRYQRQIRNITPHRRGKPIKP